MSRRSKELAERLKMQNDDIITFVRNCSEDNWRRVCAWEDWGIGVVARHIGAGHYDILGLARMIVNGEKLPEFTPDQIIRMANDHAREHADCTKAEVLDILQKNGKAVYDFIIGLGDAELDRTGYLPMIGKEVSTRQFLEMVILQSGGEHFVNMKTALSE